MSFRSTTLSVDPRTQCILQRAIRCMSGVHTLRIILGHQYIVEGLIRGFFHYERISQAPVRRLWIESSYIDRCYWDPRISSIASGLESIRMRRMYISRTHEGELLHLARSRNAQTGSSGTYEATTHISELSEHAVEFESRIYTNLAQQYPGSILQCCGKCNCPGCANGPRRDQKDTLFFYGVLTGQSETLTSITFDWLLNGRAVVEALTLTRPQFPRLKALQIRNAVDPPAELELSSSSAALHPVCYLLGPVWLDFLQRHPNLECLAWPMEYFLPGVTQSRTLGDDGREVIKTLSHRLRSLRIDARVMNHHLDNIDMFGAHSPQALVRQRAFIHFVASQMRSLKVFKVEGTIPIELRYELLQALQHCSLQKVVIIGVNWAVANTWTDLEEHHSSHWRLEIGRPVFWKSAVPSSQQISTQDDLVEAPEDPEALSLEIDEYPKADFSLLKLLVLSQATSVSELKFCGFIGSPMLYYPSPKAQLELSYLKGFHNLRYLTMAVWLAATHENQDLSSQIPEFWNAATNESARSSQHFYGTLTKYYSPAVLADKITELVGPNLSPQACACPAGVSVKVLFLVRQSHRSEIFELQVQIGKQCNIVKFAEIRGENNPKKLQEKMQERKWF